VVLNSHDNEAPASLRWFVAITPHAGAMAFALIVTLVMARVGIAAGVAVALVLSSFWFIAMLKTSEMPH
jgi:MFS superfamily sulfate permease-like transporter